MRPVAIALSVLMLWSCASAPIEIAPLDERQRGEFIRKVSKANSSGWSMLCDTEELRVAVGSDATRIFVEAIVWHDNEGKLGVYRVSDRPVGDYAELMIHFGGGKERVALRDMDVGLNPWPERQGVFIMRYETTTATAPLQKSKSGVGTIEYLPGEGGRFIRVDRLEIPLSELGIKPGDTIRTAYYVSSPVPNIIANSAFTLSQKEYYSHQIPVASFREFKLQN